MPWHPSFRRLPVQQDLHVLRGLLDKRESVLTRLERAELKRRASKDGEEPMMWTGPCCLLGDRVGAVGYLTEELSYYNVEVGSCDWYVVVGRWWLVRDFVG